MKANSLSQEIEKIEKKDLSFKEAKKKKQTKNASTSSNLPEVRKVALSKRRARIVLLTALFVSCFSLSVFIGFIGPFLLFK